MPVVFYNQHTVTLVVQIGTLGEFLGFAFPKVQTFQKDCCYGVGVK